MDWGQVAVGLALAIPSFVIGFLAHRRSKRVDAISEQSGLATGALEGTAQILAGLNGLIDTLQEDNKTFRGDLRYLTTRLDACNRERDKLQRELARYRHRYGNDLPPSG